MIDDLGQNLETAKQFMALPMPLTFAVLPHQRHSREIAELARSQHHEVILHLPMEPHGYPGVNSGEGTLLLSMSRDELLKNVRSALDSTPGVSGVNNHMGSRFTENAGSMKIVLAELKTRGLYFIDSGTSPTSSARSAAHEVGIAFRKRDFFLDHNPSENAVRLQLKRLIRNARIEGTALGIGHPYGSTYRVLRGAVKQFKQEQIAVVSARELVASGAYAAHRNQFQSQ